jgi:hypothetical protein
MKSVDQKTEAKFQAIRGFILANRNTFVRQGAVVATYRMYRGHRLGPFFSLRYRDAGRQRSRYLGRSPNLAAQVSSLLGELRETIKELRTLTRLKRHARANVRMCKKLWRQDLATLGLNLKGCEVRGWTGIRQGSVLSATMGKIKDETS